MNKLLVLLFLYRALFASEIGDKVLICGIARNVEKAVANTISSIEKLGGKFQEYHVIIYENNSKDTTAKLFQKWAKKNKHVTFISEHIREKKMVKFLSMGVMNRYELMARARNKVLDIAMQDTYADYKYVIWADLDFLHPWDIDNIVATILHPEKEWDAVFANGFYDLLAYRDAEFPLGFELLGSRYWGVLDEMRARLMIDKKGPWKRVYSAFGGLAIYKREALKGCKYSGVVTKDLEKMMELYLQSLNPKTCYYDLYQELRNFFPVVNLEKGLLNRAKYPNEVGVRLCHPLGLGKIVWFSCTDNYTLPAICEHIPLHASMALHGYDKLFVNPRLISRQDAIVDAVGEGRSLEEAVEAAVQYARKKYDLNTFRKIYKVAIRSIHTDIEKDQVIQYTVVAEIYYYFDR